MNPISKNNLSAYLIVAATSLLVLCRVPELFSFGPEIVGWDTAGHFASWQEWRSQGAPLFPPWIYQWKWLGGSSLFKFYPPLSIFLLEATALLTRLSEEDCFRLLLILAFTLPAFLLIPLSAEYLKRANVASSPFIALPSLTWLLYPRFLSWSGHGFAAITGGMLAGALGLSLFLLLTTFLLRFQAGGSRRNLYFAMLLAALLPITHYVASIAFIIFVPFWFATTWKRSLTLENVGIALLLLSPTLLLFSQFFTDGWLVFSGPTYGILSLPLLLFPLHVPTILDLSFKGLHILIALVGVLSLAGLVRAIRTSTAGIALFAFCCMGMFLLEYFPLFLGTRFFHFYRLFPYFYLLLIPLAAVYTCSIWSNSSNVMRKVMLLLACYGIVDGVHGLRWTDSISMPEASGHYQISAYRASSSSYRDKSLTKAMVQALFHAGYRGSSRVFVETEATLYQENISSIHGLVFSLTSMGVRTLNGLYVESAPQSLIVQSLICSVTKSSCWGPQTFKKNPKWGPGYDENWLKVFEGYGTEYIFSLSEEFERGIEKIGYAEKVSAIRFGKRSWTLWKLPSPRPIVSPAKTKPFLFISPGDPKPFLQFLSLHFLTEDLRSMPVFYRKELSYQAAKELLCSQEVFSGVLLPETDAAENFRSTVDCDMPSYILPWREKLHGESFEEDIPSIDANMQSSVLRWMKQSAQPIPTPASFNAVSRSSRIFRFQTDTSGAALLNGGFDSSWKHQSSPVFITSPYLQMGLLSAKGDNTLLYQPNVLNTFRIPFATGALGLLTLALGLVRRKRGQNV